MYRQTIFTTSLFRPSVEIEVVVCPPSKLQEVNRKNKYKYTTIMIPLSVLEGRIYTELWLLVLEA